MIGDIAYADLTTWQQGTEQHHARAWVRTPQWADGILSFSLNAWQTQNLKGLVRLKRLCDNWDGEGSPRPSAIALDSASELLVSLPFEDLPTPFVSPTSLGGVQLEWTQHGRELEIEILPDGSMEFLTVLNGTPQNEGPTSREEVSSLARWLRDEPEQNRTGGIFGRVNSLTRT